MVEFRFLQMVARAEAARKRRYTVTDLAEGMGVTRATVSKWHNMSTRPIPRHGITLDGLAKICTFLECQPGDLLVYHSQ